ncbi:MULTISPECIES: hypothetical protein [unclassified Cellulophaga]|uniref:hypothetical protein n=2 Tax=Cellulophaga TaxID=104264 RepID=UPI000C2B97BC|nr:MULTISPECIES: hypothetical protein [unclassified Cellulophaga]MDO6492448.1 hypothetical protein [Cellulophaga sp. 2_MG-2023]MDO6496052.1 hypothetical protein [Cellulophaga sp. 3_MG-2023]PKB44895.1 hypothetical protein AX016_3127 [Cellulophaga sp. RHA19]
MKYTDFKELKEKPVGLACDILQGYPLEFGDLTYRLDDYDLYDWLEDNEMEDFDSELLERYPNYESLGALDLEYALEIDPDFHFDSYAEFVLFVDTTKKDFPVVIFDGQDIFATLYDTFELFYASLYKVT